MSDEHVFDQLPGYALGSLDEQEVISVIQHLDRCKICRAELVAYQAVTDQLGLAAPQIEPPASLKQKILQGVEIRQKPALSVQRRASFLETLRSWFLPWRWAVVLLVFALVGSNLVLWGQINSLKAVSQPSYFRTVALAGTSINPQANGMLVISANGEYGTLVVQNLTPLDAQHQYQLWLIKDGKRTSGGVFSVSIEGYNSMLVYSPQPLRDYTGFGITIEPSGGSPQPTGKKVMGSS